MSDTTRQLVRRLSGLPGAIVQDMERQYPSMRLRCTVCGHVLKNDWSYLSSGWPRCCGYTMRLEKANTPEGGEG